MPFGTDRQRLPIRPAPKVAWLLALLAAVPAWSQGTPDERFDQDVFISAEVRPEECQVGETVEYRVYATVRNNITHRLEASPPAFGKFEVLGDPALRQTDKDDETIFEWTFAIRPREAGTLVIQPFSVTYLDMRDRQTRMLASDRVTLKVRSPEQPRDIRPARGLVEVPDATARYRLLFLMAGVAAALGALTLGLAWLLARAARRPPAEPPPPPVIPPETVALRRLAELEREDLYAQGEIDAYHVRLSEILRQYLGARYEFNAQESTTTEIASYLHADGLASETVAEIRETLYGCDLEKFAGYVPGRPEMEHLMRQARDLIERTKAAAPEEDG